jgi:hypothetical protein
MGEMVDRVNQVYKGSWVPVYLPTLFTLSSASTFFTLSTLSQIMYNTHASHRALKNNPSILTVKNRVAYKQGHLAFLGDFVRNARF